MPGPGLSAALRVADVNDFLSPSAACVLPLAGGATAAVAAAPAGSVLAPIMPRGRDPVAAVTLSDCLSCSGCVTSAETVLLSSAGLDAARDMLVSPADPRVRDARLVVVALSQQAVASIAVRLRLPLQDAAARVAAFFRSALRADVVVDVAFARCLALEEAAAEFVARRRAGDARVVLASACPGWVTYAEKTQGEDVLARISRVRSPQAVAGAVLPKLLASDVQRPDGPPLVPWVLSVMPCHDKKLEASRPSFAGRRREGEEAMPDVACVLTASEVMQLADDMSVDIAALKPVGLDPRFSAGPCGFGSRTATGSGGYADFVLRKAARELLGVELGERELEMEKASRSGDVKSIVVTSEDGTKQLRFGTAYGFRSLQSVLRKIRRGECEYDYIEIMACPGGCNNGGGQIPSETQDKKAMNNLLAEVNAVYATSGNSSSESSAAAATKWSRAGLVDGDVQADEGHDLKDVMYTDYKKLEQNTIHAVTNW